MHLEHAESEAATGLAREPAHDFVLAALEHVGRLEEDALTLGGRRRRPSGERGGGGIDRAPRVGTATGGDTGDHVAAEGVDVVAGAIVGGAHPLAADELPAYTHVAVDSRGHECVLLGHGWHPAPRMEPEFA